MIKNTVPVYQSKSIYARKALLKLVILNGYFYHQQSMSTAYLRPFINVPKSAQKLDFILGSRLTARDPETKQLYFANKSYEVKHSNIVSKVAQLNRNIYNYFICQCYEVLETYLYDIAAELCSKNKRQASSLPKMINLADRKSYRKYLKLKLADTGDLYKQIIFKLISPDKLPKLKTRESFEFFLRALILSRHAITHSEGRISVSSIKPQLKEYLSEFFGIDFKKRILLIDCTKNKENIKFCMQIIMLIENSL